MRQISRVVCDNMFYIYDNVSHSETVVNKVELQKLCTREQIKGVSLDCRGKVLAVKPVQLMTLESAKASLIAGFSVSISPEYSLLGVFDEVSTITLSDICTKVDMFCSYIGQLKFACRWTNTRVDISDAISFFDHNCSSFIFEEGMDEDWVVELVKLGTLLGISMSGGYSRYVAEREILVAKPNVRKTFLKDGDDEWFLNRNKRSILALKDEQYQWEVCLAYMHRDGEDADLLRIAQRGQTI